MKKIVKYKNYCNDKDAFTIKLTYLPKGGIEENPAVKVQIMRPHQPPRTFKERIAEGWKYNINDFMWDTLLNNLSLDDFCVGCCNAETARRIAIEKTEKEFFKNT